MSKIIQCKICRMPFNSLGRKICHNCLDEIDEAFIRIREYLNDNPDKSTVDEICEATETPKSIVLHLIDENRLTTFDKITTELNCRYCHQPITKGIMCEKCKNELAQTLLHSIPKQERTNTNKDISNSKMHVDHVKKRY